MSKYLKRFKSVGKNCSIADDVYIEHPETMEIGDNVTFMKGFHLCGKTEICRFGSNITFYPNCFIQGAAGRFIIEDHVNFFPNNYVSLGKGEACFVEIGHHSHFAPGCVLYGWGGLTIGAYCNVAAHVVLATVGHHDEILDQPMALTGEKPGPITIEEDVWIAANCTISAHTTIARGCVIGANAVVTKDTQPMGVYAGVPAHRLRDR